MSSPFSFFFDPIHTKRPLDLEDVIRYYEGVPTYQAVVKSLKTVSRYSRSKKGVNKNVQGNSNNVKSSFLRKNRCAPFLGKPN